MPRRGVLRQEAVPVPVLDPLVLSLLFPFCHVLLCQSDVPRTLCAAPVLSSRLRNNRCRRPLDAQGVDTACLGEVESIACPQLVSSHEGCHARDPVLVPSSARQGVIVVHVSELPLLSVWPPE